ncbi:response regulator [Oryzomonas japonica]|uniref:Response regulator n=1 Tax=Oryzomonas japonica TaxID=2603858 RepID=A0A7J4ZRX8_9BACT|nr:response regulator [Oryzomonas japonica]KAB0666024.1 response regulator [Oryzomonas japonica]
MNDTILLVDDEPNVLTALTRSLIDEPYQVLTAPSGDKALEMVAAMPVKVIVSDERMAGMSGSQLLAEVRRRFPPVIRILLTGHATLEAAMRAVNEGEIYRFFTKPWDEPLLRFALRSAIEKYDLEAENRRLLATVKSQAMEIKVLERRYPGISRVAKDGRGSFILPDIPDDDIARILEECEKEAHALTD